MSSQSSNHETNEPAATKAKEEPKEEEPKEEVPKEEPKEEPKAEPTHPEPPANPHEALMAMLDKYGGPEDIRAHLQIPVGHNITVQAFRKYVPQSEFPQWTKVHYLEGAMVVEEFREKSIQDIYMVLTRRYI